MEKPIRVPVMLCAGCEAVYDHGRDEDPCCETYRPSRGQTGVAHLVPDSLEAKLLELGRAYRAYREIRDILDTIPYGRAARPQLLAIDEADKIVGWVYAAVKQHPDYTPAQKEGT